MTGWAWPRLPSEKPADILPHLVFPVRPVVPALLAPVVEMVRDAAAREDFRETIRGPAVFPRPAAGGDVDVAGGELREHDGVGKIREVIDGIIEIEVVVVEAVHELLEVVDAGQGKAALHHIRMFEERIGGMIGAEGSAHRGDGNVAGLAAGVNEGDDLKADVGVELGLDVTAVEGVGALVVEGLGVDGVDGEDF